MKGRLEEMYSKARFTEGEYYVDYRDFKEVIRLPIKEFEKIAEIVPTHRIARIIERKIIPSEQATIPVSFSVKNEAIYESSDPDLLALPVVERFEVDTETLRFVEMRDALATKYLWQRYIELERIKRLKEEGRELLGEIIYIQPKRDGENISLWLEGTDTEVMAPHVSSHNMVNADPAIVSRFTVTPEFNMAVELLKTEKEKFNKTLILFGELVNKGKGATRIEPTHKNAHWYLFDIYDVDAKTYYPYPLVYQMAYHYDLLMIEALETWTPWKMEDIDPKVAEWKKWAKRHRREGVVGKVYKDGVLLGFKEKIDLPDLPPIPRQIAERATFPPMPEEKVLRALQHAWDETEGQFNSHFNKESKMAISFDGKQYLSVADMWRDKSIAMPLIAKHINVEAKEHNFNPPRNIFEIYLNTPIERIRTPTI